MKRVDVNIQRAREFIETHYRKNRTIVSADIPSIFDGIETTIGLPVIRHYFPSGKDYATWIVPPQWDVREAWLKDSGGKVLASYRGSSTLCLTVFTVRACHSFES